MKLFFLLVEIFMYLFAFYLLIYKRELSIIYIPVLLFVRSFIETILPVSLFVALVSGFFLVFFNKNPYFFYKNIWSFLSIIWYFFLLHKVSDLDLVKTVFVFMLWLFLCIPLINSIYQKYTKSEVLREMANASFIILVLFILNVMASTVFRFNPTEMYGISSGLFYGKLYATDFNILSTVIFISTLSLMKKRNIPFLIILVISMAFLMLTMRRSVMMLAMLGIGIAVFIHLDPKNIKTFVMVGVASVFFGFVILLTTPFLDIFKERYELRNLEERDLEGEHRFLEYELLYKDMFLFHDYSPWTGFELFNSGGNYGKGIFGMRTLHSDLTNMTHSAGLVGTVIYFIMVFVAFKRAFRASNCKMDYFILIFCFGSFIFYTITGRYANIQSHFMIFLILFYPLAKNDNEEPDALEQPAEEIEEKNPEEVPVI
jgi:O-antigen ligase